MKRASIEVEIRPIIESFVAELATLVRRAILQSALGPVEAAMRANKPARRARMQEQGRKVGTLVARGPSPARAKPTVDAADVPSREDYERAAIQRALAEADGHMVRAGKLLGMPKSAIYRRARFLGVSNRGEPVRPTLGSRLPLDLDAYERAAIDGALDACGRDKLAAAKLLGLSKSTMYRRAEALGIVG